MPRVMVAHQSGDELWEAEFVVDRTCSQSAIVSARLNGHPSSAAKFVNLFGLGVYEEACDLAISDLDREEEEWR